MQSLKRSAAHRMAGLEATDDGPRDDGAGDGAVAVLVPQRGGLAGADTPRADTPRAGQPVWHALPDELQLILAREAMLRAAATLADQAELLAMEMEAGALSDRGGPDALRLFAAIIRATNADTMGPVGNA
jgi:hypothetical protein